MAPKRKRSSLATSTSMDVEVPMPPPDASIPLVIVSASKPSLSRQSTRSRRQSKVDTNPDHNAEIVDGPTALRASPDADERGESMNIEKAGGVPSRKPSRVSKKSMKEEDSDSPLSDVEMADVEEPTTPPSKKAKKTKTKTPTKSSIAAKKGAEEIKAFKAEQDAKKKAAETKIKKEEDDGNADGTARGDPEGEGDFLTEDIDAVKREAARPPPVHSSYLPLPWKGRLGYACLNTYLRLSNPPIFSSRTCRIASILEHRHPLQDPSQPEHASKNRPDKTKPADDALGKRYVEELGLANVRDIPKMLRWNEKYGIRFLRLSSEMFPFASHDVYGYRLAPFASEALAEAGKVAAELGHRLTTHPGQFTQLGSPRAEVIKNAIRDLEYHDEMLSLLKLPPQEDRDAVMILHLGGTFGDKAATLERFRDNYKNLSPSVKQRLVLENDDVSWSVHDLLPLCEELNIPLVLDFHHHNIIFDSSELREGTNDIVSLFPRIKATWDRKGIRQKMHYSEPCPEAVTGRQRRKHNPRPATLPPCPNDMDLMIEAKDKEQAVFELMRTFKLPGWNTFNDIIPYERMDDNKPLPRKAKKKKTKKQIAAEIEEFGRELSEEEEAVKAEVPEEEIGMGGPENRVYWPPGMEEWLRPKKRDVKKKGPTAEDDLSVPTPYNFAARREAKLRETAVLSDDLKEKLKNAENLKDIIAVMDEIRALSTPGDPSKADAEEHAGEEDVAPAAKKRKPAPAKNTPKKKPIAGGRKQAKSVPTPSVSDMDDEEEDDEDMSMLDSDEDGELPSRSSEKKAPERQSRRVSGKKTSYVEVDEDEEMIN